MAQSKVSATASNAAPLISKYPIVFDANFAAFIIFQYWSVCVPLLRAILLEFWNFAAGIRAPSIMSHVDTRLTDLNAAPSSKYATEINDDYIIILTISEWP